jgi:hypothetical protein
MTNGLFVFADGERTHTREAQDTLAARGQRTGAGTGGRNQTEKKSKQQEQILRKRKMFMERIYLCREWSLSFLFHHQGSLPCCLSLRPLLTFLPALMVPSKTTNLEVLDGEWISCSTGKEISEIICSQCSGSLPHPLHISAWSCWSITIVMTDGRTDNRGFDHWQLMRERA